MKFLLKFIFFLLPFFAEAQISFFTSNTFSTATAPFAFASGDFDNDGDIDIAVACTTGTGGNTISIFLNRCGYLSAKVDYALPAGGTAPIDLASGDLDGDGDLDLVTANYSSTNISVLTGNGNGTFTAGSNYGAGTNPRSITLAYLDGDADLDAAIVNTGSNTVTILPGAAGATFGAALGSPGVGSAPIGIVSGDWDGNSTLDLAVANYNAGSGTTVSIITNNPAGTFNTTSSPTVAAGPRTVSAFNFDGTNGLDIIAPTSATAGSFTTDDISILLNNGSGTFPSVPAANTYTYTVNYDPASIALADFDGDGKTDIANTLINASKVTILRCTATSPPTFAAQSDLSVGGTPRSVIAPDLNNDGHPDLVVANSASNTISVFLNAAPYSNSPAIDDKMNMIYANTSSNYNTYGYSVVHTQDGGYIMAGKTPGWGDEAENTPSLLKMDKNGTRQWIKYFTKASDNNLNGEAKYITQTADGNYILAGKFSTATGWGGGSTDAWLIKTTACGDTVWTRGYGTTAVGSEANLYPVMVQQVVTSAGADDGYVILANNGVNDQDVIRVTSSGALSWTTRIASPRTDAASYIITTDDNDADNYKDDGFLVAGYTVDAKPIGSSAKDIWLIKLAANGSITWEKAYGGTTNTDDDEAVAVQEIDIGNGVYNDEYIVAGYTTISSVKYASVLKIASDGSLTLPGGWLTSIGKSPSDAIVRDIKQIDTDGDGYNDDAFIMAGTMENSGAAVENVLLIKTNTNGTLAWADTIAVKWSSPTSQDYGYAITQTVDKGFAIAGHSSYYGPDNFYLAKVNSSGQNSCSSSSLAMTTGTTTPNNYNVVATFSSVTLTAHGTPATVYSTSSRLPSANDICAPTVLPVELISFSAGCTVGKVLVKWETASEINNNYFSVERSTDGINFETVGIVNGAGNSSGFRKYEFTDAEIPSAQPVYYRLKQTDFDGKYEYFSPVSARCYSENGISVYPNPFSLTATIECDEEQKNVRFRLLDVTGREIRNSFFSGTKIILERNGLSTGVYFYEISSDNNKAVGKVIVQ